MNEFLLILILVSAIINFALFAYLYRTKKRKKKKNSFTRISEHESKRFQLALEEEVHKVERYEEYSFCLAFISLKEYPESIFDEIRNFIRKSDGIYFLENKIYILFPFLKLSSEFELKIKETLVQSLKEKNKNLKLIKVEVQECSIDKILDMKDIVYE